MSDLVNLGFRADTRGLLGAQRELDRTTAAGGRLDKQSAALTKTLGLVGAAITAVGVTAGSRQIIQYADSWANLNTQLRQVTKSEQELVGIRSQLLAVSRDTRIDLDATVGLYTEMTRGTSELGISSEKLLGITKTLNNLFLAGGKPLSEMTGAIRQLNQGFASGVLRGDEFNSVAEGAPRILDAMAAKLNMTRGELRAFAATGGITAEVMIDALADFEGTAQKLADTVKITFEQTMGLVQTNITEFVGQNELLTSSVDSLGSKLLSLSENIDAVGYAMGAAAAVVGVSLLPVMGKYLISVGSAIYANITAVPAITGVSAALGVQAKALTAGSIAANAFGVAWRFALGPVGLLVTALGAAAVTFNLVSENMDIANKKAKEHADAMSELETIYAKWSKTRLEGERNKLLERSNEILFERLDIEEKIQKLSANATMQRGMETIVNPEVLAEIEQLEKSLASLGNENENIDNSLGKVLAALDAFITKKKEATTTVDKSVEANRKLADSYNSQILSLHNQRTALQMTGDEFELYTAKQTALMYGATEAMLENVEKQVKALQKSRKEFELFANFEETMNAPDWIANMGGDLDSVESKIDSFGGAWSRTGSVIVDAFGDMGDAMNSYMQSMDELSSIQKELDAEKKKSGADLVKIAKLEQSVNEKKVSAELSGYKALANGAAGMFSEKTAAAKAFTAISQVLAVTEIALSYQKMAAGTAETAVHVTNETTKQGSNALTAITAAFAAPFPVGFVAGAAMIGIMASLLGDAFGGGGGSSYVAPEIGGTGTILGDDEAQSASITNAFDKLEDIQLDQLSELRGIRSSMQALNNGIASLAKSFVTGLDFSDSGYAGQLGTSTKGIADVIGISMPSLIEKMPSFIDPILSFFVGGFSSKKKELLDSGITFVSQTFADIFNSGQLDASVFQVIETTKKKFWGASKKVRVNTELSEIDNAILEQMGSIFGFIGDSVLGAVNSLFGDNLAQDALAGFQIDIGDVSFKDKTGDEIQKELEAIFSQQADLIAKYLVPSIAEYQQMGEGAFETLQRVAYEQAVFNDALERTSMSLSNLSALMQIDVAQSIIGMVGGLERFSELSNSFFESFYSDAEQLAYLEGSLGNAFEGLGLSLVKSREGFKDLINGIDITTEAGQALYAALLELVPGMDKYLSALEDEEEERRQARINFLKDERSELQSTANSLASLVGRINAELGQSFTIQEALAAARKGDFDVAMSMTNQRVSSRNFGDPIAFARAQAIEVNRLAQISSLAGEEKSEIERQIELLDKQIDAINNGTEEIVNAIINLGKDPINGGAKRDNGEITIPPPIIDFDVMSGKDTANYNDLKRGGIEDLRQGIKNSESQSREYIERGEMMSREIVKNTKTTARILQRMEFGGSEIQ